MKFMSEVRPTSLRNKRIHLMLFIDASQPKNITFNFKQLVLFGFFLITFTGSSLGALFLYINQKIILDQALAHNKILKASVLAQSLKLEILPENLRKESSHTVLANITEILQKSKITPVDYDAVNEKRIDLGKVSKNLSNLDEATITMVQAGSDAGILSDNTAVNTAVNGAVSTAVNGAVSTTVSAPTSVPLDASAVNPAKTDENAPLVRKPPETLEVFAANGVPSLDSKSLKLLKFQNFQLVDDSEVESELKTSFTLDLVNEDPTRPLSGKVCALVKYLDESGSPAKETIPPDLSVVGERLNPQKGCMDGEFVRFARLRPTLFSLKAPSEAVKSIKIFFAESTSKRIYSYVFENKPSINLQSSK